MQLRRAQVGAQRGHCVGHCGDNAALSLEHALALVCVQEFHVFGEHAVLVLCTGIGLHEAVNEFAQPGLGRHRPRGHVQHQRLEPRHVPGGDVRQQVLLVTHVVVQRGFAHAAGGRHVVHGGGRVAAGGKEPRRGGQDLLELARVAGGARAGHGPRASAFVEGDHHAIGQRVGLAGEHEAGIQVGLLERKIAIHAHAPLQQLGAAGGAHARAA